MGEEFRLRPSSIEIVPIAVEDEGRDVLKWA